MKGADNIKSVILADAKENAEKISAEAVKRAENILIEAQKQADDFLDAQIKLAESEGGEIIEKAKTEGRLSVRRAVLSYKQQLLKEVFAKAESYFENLKGDDFVNTVVRVIKANADGGEVVLSNENLEKYGCAIAEKLGQGFSLAEKGEDIGAGAVIRQGKIEINCRFSSIIRRLAENDAQNISDILFGG